MITNTETLQLQSKTSTSRSSAERDSGASLVLSFLLVLALLREMVTKNRCLKTIRKKSQRAP